MFEFDGHPSVHIVTCPACGSDHESVTFGCRIGHVAGQDGPACSLVTGAAARSDRALFGQKLSRGQALEHPRLAEMWEVVDWLIVNDPTLHEHVFHMPPR